MSAAYETHLSSLGHGARDRWALLAAAATVAGVWCGRNVLIVALPCLGLLAVRRVRRAVALLLVLVLAAVIAGGHAWAEAHPRHLGSYAGWVQLVSDPSPSGPGMKVTIRVEGERFDAWLFGGQRIALGGRQAGEWAWVSGRRRPSTGAVRRALIRHVVGRFDLQAVDAIIPGNAVDRASNRVRSLLRRRAEQAMQPVDASLFTGLVIGDDARQPAWLVDEFRTSGLSHLTAVSGQNVAFVLAAAMPLLRRLRPWWRWLATVGLIAWFMALTRFEPSVLRAGVMAMFAATGFAVGREVRPARAVSAAVVVLVLVDPMLVWSVGFWLSVGATLGVALAGPWWAARLPGPRWWRVAAGVTLGAQTGVALPSILVFHRLAVMSLPANLLAVPVAGFVMLYGIPAALAASWSPAIMARLLMAPSAIGTRWVALVARVAAAFEPGGRAELIVWLMVGVGLATIVLRRSRPAPARVPI
jgi:competence protein ComEC